MKLLCDENIKTSILNLLGQEGHDTTRVQSALEIGFDDEDIIEHCRSDDRVLLTNDEDFLAFDHHSGILYLTEQTTPPRAVATAIRNIERHLPEDVLRETVVHVPNGWK
jgi:predicted nuclease of predicted toxin-antitoxin system